MLQVRVLPGAPTFSLYPRFRSGVRFFYEPVRLGGDRISFPFQVYDTLRRNSPQLFKKNRERELTNV